MHRPGFAPIILLIVAALLAVAIGGYALFAAKNAANAPNAPAAPQAPSPTQAIPSPAPSPSTTPASSSTSAIDTSNWKTYTNQQRGFSVQYPSDWTIKEQGGSVLFINAQNQQFTVEVLESTTEDRAMSLGGFVKTSSSLFYGSEVGNSSATQSMISGNQVFSANTLVRIYGINGGYQGTGEGFTALIEKDNHFAMIDAAAISENIFDKVLSTFQFIQL